MPDGQKKKNLDSFTYKVNEAITKNNFRGINNMPV